MSLARILRLRPFIGLHSITLIFIFLSFKLERTGPSYEVDLIANLRWSDRETKIKRSLKQETSKKSNKAKLSLQFVFLKVKTILLIVQ